MASGCSPLDALETLNRIAESDDHASSSLARVAIGACSSKESLVNSCGKSLLDKLVKSKSGDEDRIDKQLQEQMMEVLAKNTLSSMDKPELLVGSDFSKGKGKVADIGSREHVNIYEGL